MGKDSGTPQQTSPVPGQYPPQQYPPGQYPPQQYPAGQYPPQQYPPGQYPQQQYPPGQYPPQQYPPGQYPPQQYPPQQYPPQQYPQQHPYGQPNQAQYNPSGYPPNQYPPQGYPPQQMPQGYPNTPQNPACGVVGGKGSKQKYVLMGTCIPSMKCVYDANPAIDAKTLEKAFKGFGCDEKTVIKIITHRTSSQREQIKNEFKKSTGKDLIERTKKELMDPLERIIVSLLYTGAEQDAYLLRKATKGLGTNDDMLMQIICTRSPAQLSAIKDVYVKMFGKTLMEHVKGDTSGNYKRLLLYLIESPRPQCGVDMNAVAEIVSSIYDRSGLKMGAPEDLITKFCACSIEQFIQINQMFYKQFSKPLHKYLKSYINGNYEQALITMSHYYLDPINYYAKFLRKCIKDLSFNALIMVICTRCEIDLESIATAYEVNYKKNLYKEIKSTFDESYSQSVDAIQELMGQKKP